MTSPSKDTVRVEHTPTPWTFKVGGSYQARKDSNFGGYAVRVTSLTGLVAKVYGDTAKQAEANTAILDRAVNAHDELVKALQDIVRFLRGTNTLSTRGAEIEISRLCNNAEAALSRVQEGE